jgi:hypothetical protein
MQFEVRYTPFVKRIAYLWIIGSAAAAYAVAVLNQIEDTLWCWSRCVHGSTPQPALGPTEAAKLCAEADAIRGVLVQELAKNANQNCEEMSATRERWRRLRGLEFAARFSLESKLYAPDSDAIIAQAMKDLRDGNKEPRGCSGSD